MKQDQMIRATYHPKVRFELLNKQNSNNDIRQEFYELKMGQEIIVSYILLSYEEGPLINEAFPTPEIVHEEYFPVMRSK